MRETPIYLYYAFGYNYRLLRVENKGVKAKGGQGNALEGRITRFLKNLDELDLPVTRGAAADLERIRDEVQKLADDTVVDDALSTRVRNAADKLDATLDSELQLRKAFVVTPKRFELKYLLEEPWQLLGEASVNRLPDLARFD